MGKKKSYDDRLRWRRSLVIKRMMDEGRLPNFKKISGTRCGPQFIRYVRGKPYCYAA